MPRAGWIKPDVDHRLSDHLAFAVLTRVFPPAVVDDVIAEVGRMQRRTRILPSRIVVYYVLGLALFSHSSYDEVIRLLIAGQSWSSGWSQSWQVPTKAALYKARLRLGFEPLRGLFDRVAKPIAAASSGTGYYREWRVLGVDAVSLDIPGTAANRLEFDRPCGDGEPAALPQVRVLGLTELGTGAIVGAAIGRLGDDQRLVAELMPNLSPGQLVIGGPGLYSPQLWEAAVASGADLVWELPDDAVFEAGTRHVDGSYATRTTLGVGSVPGESRVVEARILEQVGEPDAAGDVRVRRFITTIQDSQSAPAAQLTGLFANRRSLASAFDEFRAHRNSPRVVLRSKMPAGVLQEIYGYLCVHYAMRWIMNAPEAQHGGSPSTHDVVEFGPTSIS